MRASPRDPRRPPSSSCSRCACARSPITGPEERVRRVGERELRQHVLRLDGLVEAQLRPGAASPQRPSLRYQRARSMASVGRREAATVTARARRAPETAVAPASITSPSASKARGVAGAA
ncbi:MAG: hypothetical protein MZV64_23800 [Ignavibacteriales bacterium]|nr:hypothetical protein [Ignavibacteriales bacterium]